MASEGSIRQEATLAKLHEDTCLVWKIVARSLILTLSFPLTQ